MLRVNSWALQVGIVTFSEAKVCGGEGVGGGWGGGWGLGRGVGGGEMDTERRIVIIICNVN